MEADTGAIVPWELQESTANWILSTNATVILAVIKMPRAKTSWVTTHVTVPQSTQERAAKYTIPRPLLA